MRRSLVRRALLAVSFAFSFSAPAAAAPVQWVTLPAGTFLMGNPHDSKNPPRKVAVKSFAMSRTPVTNQQYRACVKAGACTPARDYGKPFNGEDQPVVGVTWFQARAFARFSGGRLPSEAEWEYAARSGGKDKRYTADCTRVVFRDASGAGCGRKSTWPVCAKTKGNTEQGLCDILGHVMEWLEDADPTGLSPSGSTEGANRLLRGVPWDDTAYPGVPALSHESEQPGDEFDFVGIRLAKDSAAGKP